MEPTIHRFVVSEEYEDERADKFIAQLLPECSRSYIQKLIKDGRVTVSGKVLKPSYKIQLSDEICLALPEPEILQITPQNIPLDIIYEDNDLVIINKPKDMVVHPAAGHYDGTLVNALLWHCKDLSGINGVLRPGIVHRIDKDTTGLLIVCKNDICHNCIAEQLKVHSIERTYHAIVCGNIKENSGTVDAPIGRHPDNRKKMSINQTNGKHAVTHYEVLERFCNYTYVKCNLETGRTHQIRVHMASLGHPLLGDEVYGKKSSAFPHTNGQTLHAKTIGFVHPASNDFVSFDSDLPAYFETILNTLRRKG